MENDLEQADVAGQDALRQQELAPEPKTDRERRGGDQEQGNFPDHPVPRGERSRQEPSEDEENAEVRPDGLEMGFPIGAGAPDGRGREEGAAEDRVRPDPGGRIREDERERIPRRDTAAAAAKEVSARERTAAESKRKAAARQIREYRSR